MGGACLEEHSGKVHPLTSGTVNGDQVTWTHKKSFLFHNLNVVYTATLEGDEMHGRLSAAGHSGPFVAARLTVPDAS